MKLSDVSEPSVPAAIDDFASYVFDAIRVLQAEIKELQAELETRDREIVQAQVTIEQLKMTQPFSREFG